MKIIVDPPSGHKYGFPKELPMGIINFRQWLIDNGYPEKDVDWAMENCGYWEKEND